MKTGLSVREAAAELGLHRNVVFRWRHRLSGPRRGGLADTVAV
ncbi:MAG: helix-turn-helix domain-containing protein [Burkholderiaceae bacterium]|nr:helix-turn-helix domain-containing protein [Burkholderiaceae bacterium]